MWHGRRGDRGGRPATFPTAGQASRATLSTESDALRKYFSRRACVDGPDGPRGNNEKPRLRRGFRENWYPQGDSNTLFSGREPDVLGRWTMGATAETATCSPRPRVCASPRRPPWRRGPTAGPPASRPSGSARQSGQESRGPSRGRYRPRPTRAPAPCRARR
jgi:hypothetical protein